MPQLNRSIHKTALQYSKSLLSFALSPISLGLGLFVCALLLRVLYVDNLSRVFPHFYLPLEGFDQHTYYDIAHKLLNGNFDQVHYFGPGYSTYFLAPALWLFDGNVYWVKMAQAVFSSATVVLTYEIGRRAFAPSVGILAAILLCFSYLHIAHTGFMLGEEMGIFYLVGAVYGLIHYESRGQIKWLVITSTALALSVVTRPNLLTLIPLFIGLILWAAKKGQRARAGFLFLGCTVCVIGPITWHNYRADPSRIVLICSQGTINLAMGLNPDANGWFEYAPNYTDIHSDEYFLAVSNKTDEGSTTLNILQWIVAHPGLYLDLSLRKLGLFFYALLLPDNIRFNSDVAQTWLGMGKGWVQFWHLSPLAFAAFFLLPWRRLSLGQWTIVGVWLVFTATLVGLFFVSSRLQFPLVPFLAILSAFSIYALWHAALARQWKKIGFVLIIVFLGVWFVYRGYPWYMNNIHAYLYPMLRPDGAHRVYRDRIVIKDVWWPEMIPLASQKLSPEISLRKVLILPDYFFTNRNAQENIRLHLPIAPMATHGVERAEVTISVNSNIQLKISWGQKDIADQWGILNLSLKPEFLQPGKNIFDLSIVGGTMLIGRDTHFYYGRSYTSTGEGWQKLTNVGEFQLVIERKLH